MYKKYILFFLIFIGMLFVGGKLVGKSVCAEPSISASKSAATGNQIIHSVVNNNQVSVPKPTEKAERYYKTKVFWWVFYTVWNVIIPLFFLLSGLSAGLRNWAKKRFRSQWGAIVCYFLAFTLFTFLITIPFDYYAGFVRGHAFGLSNQNFTKWIGDVCKGLLLTLIEGSIFVPAAYLLIRKSPKRWWLYGSILMVPVTVVFLTIGPVLIDPLFNRYSPINDQALQKKITTLTEQAGIQGVQVYQVNKSIDTKEMNAYMTGIFGTKRIVLWDTTISALNEQEMMALVAHEMGHYVLGHIWKSILLGTVGNIFILYMLYKSTGFTIRKAGKWMGFTHITDIASLPLIILLINLFTFASAPVSNYYGRYTEKEADRFAIELTKDNNACATLEVKIHEQSLILPNPGLIYKLWNYDHPTFQERVDFANNYSPWENDQPLKYKKYIKTTEK